MAKKHSSRPHKIPKVRIARPANRPFQLRYTDPDEKREIRISIGSRDEAEADRQKSELEARLLLGIQQRRQPKKTTGPYMPWEDFREQYTALQLSTIREKSAADAESRLDVAERILKPRTLADVANSEALHTLQAKMLEGAESRFNRPRSKHTVKGYMGSVLAALGWAAEMEWLESVPKVRKVKVSKLKQMKGRPITLEEFERMLSAVPKAILPKNATAEQRRRVGTVAESWRHVLRGAWESALRLDELMHVSWDIPGTIRPVWQRCGDPVLEIPHDLQKNDTEESIPLLPGFEALLLETPEADRTGWVFNPVSINVCLGRKVRFKRPDAEWIGKVISRIGKAAGVIVEPANPARGTKAKFASAHDLRRACAQRLDDAGVPEVDIMRVTRHAQRETLRRHYAPGNVQKSAARIRERLKTTAADVPGYTGQPVSS